MGGKNLFWDFLWYQRNPDTLGIWIQRFFVQFFSLIILEACVWFFFRFYLFLSQLQAKLSLSPNSLKSPRKNLFGFQFLLVAYTSLILPTWEAPSFQPWQFQNPRHLFIVLFSAPCTERRWGIVVNDRIFDSDRTDLESWFCCFLGWVTSMRLLHWILVSSFVKWS